MIHKCYKSNQLGVQFNTSNLTIFYKEPQLLKIARKRAYRVKLVDENLSDSGYMASLTAPAERFHVYNYPPIFHYSLAFGTLALNVSVSTFFHR